jgi:hypothetical protein
VPKRVEIVDRLTKRKCFVFAVTAYEMIALQPDRFRLGDRDALLRTDRFDRPASLSDLPRGEFVPPVEKKKKRRARVRGARRWVA